MSPEGKVAVVTGAAWGIGKAIAVALARAGARVVVADVDEEAGRLVGAEVGSFVRADVSSEVEVGGLFTGMTPAFAIAYSGKACGRSPSPTLDETFTIATPRPRMRSTA